MSNVLSRVIWVTNSNTADIKIQKLLTECKIILIIILNITDLFFKMNVTT